MYCLIDNTCMGFVRFYPDNRICESLILQYFRQIKLKIKILRINVTTALQKLARAPETYFHSILHYNYCFESGARFTKPSSE